VGSSVTKVTFTVDARQMAFYGRAMEYVVEPGEIEVYVGSSSEDIRLRGEYTIKGEVMAVSEKVFFSAVELS